MPTYGEKMSHWLREAWPAKVDVVVIGGGVVGAAVSRELSRFRLSVVLVERAPDLAAGASKANSGILHAGFDAEPGSWKARLNVRGARLYRDICGDLAIPRRETGSLVVAKTEAQRASLERLLRRGVENGVEGLEIWNPDRVFAREPNIAPDIVGALWAPSAAIVCPFTATIAFAENAARNGVRILRDCPVVDLETRDGAITAVLTSRGRIETNRVVNAAGVFADRIARMAGDDGFTITPRRGEYILFDKAVGDLTRSVLFPVPDKASKGILVSPTAHGNFFIGPNSSTIADREAPATTREGYDDVIEGARRLVPGIPLHAAIAGFAGLRADAGGDFVIGASSTVRGLVHAAGIQSPGLTAAPAIAEVVADIVRGMGPPSTPKEDFILVNPPRRSFAEMSTGERAALVSADRRHGRVICRCEVVTEGEIVEAIRAPCGARTVDGVKRRVRAGAGRCQGGFCGPRVTAVLAAELGIPITEVRKDAPDSRLFFPREDVIGGGLE